MRPLPRLYLGTMTFGWSQSSSKVDEAVASSMMMRFLEEHSGTNDSVHFDTARIYAGGRTEEILGSALPHLQDSGVKTKNISIGTKAHPSQQDGLSSTGMRNQLEASLNAMRVSEVGEFFLHQPDPKHPLLDSLRCAHELKSEGKIKFIGMSNYHASEMERAFDLCEEHGLTKPTVYQGLYNPLNRMVEAELMPVLRQHDCSFVAYNPLAAGLLTGKHSRDGEVRKGRFRKNQNYLPRFYTAKNFDALDQIQDECEKSGIGIVEATFRWLLCHSALTEKDGVLIGASSKAQLEENISACAKAKVDGDLPEMVLEAFDEAWKKTGEGAFPYWRSYSLDMPERDSRHQGAEYSAGKK